MVGGPSKSDTCFFWLSNVPCISRSLSFSPLSSLSSLVASGRAVTHLVACERVLKGRVPPREAEQSLFFLLLLTLSSFGEEKSVMIV